MKGRNEGKEDRRECQTKKKQKTKQNHTKGNPGKKKSLKKNTGLKFKVHKLIT